MMIQSKGPVRLYALGASIELDKVQGITVSKTKDADLEYPRLVSRTLRIEIESGPIEIVLRADNADKLILTSERGSLLGSLKKQVTG